MRALDNIKRNIKRLSPEDVASLRAWLLKYGNEPACPAELQKYVEAVRNLSGVNPLVKSRAYPHPLLRWMVMSLMIGDGYKTTDIGRLIGMDHSTVVLGNKSLRSALKYHKAYEHVNGMDVRELWEKINTQLGNEQESI